MKTFAFALLAIGLILGPAYWIYTKFFTGSEVALLGFSRISAADAAPVWRSQSFTLSADMAPVGLIFKAHGQFAPNMEEHRPPRDAYTATLVRDGVAADPLKFSLGVSNVANSNPVFKEHLVFMQKVQAGSYHIDIATAATPAISLDQMRLEVRQNLVEPSPNVVTTGILLFIAGILILVA